MALQFEKFAHEGNEFLNTLAEELGYPEDTERAGRVLTSVLSAVRDQLTVEESLHLMAQLPFFLKAVYVNDWSSKYLSEKPMKDYDRFLSCVREKHGRTAENDFESDDAIRTSVATVMSTLRKYVSQGELEDLRSILPAELEPMLEDALAE